MSTTSNVLELTCRSTELGFSPAKVWCPVPDEHHSIRPKAVPASIAISTWNTPDAQASFSPAPYAVVVERGRQAVLLVVAADDNWHRWNHARFVVDGNGVVAQVDLEGHAALNEARAHIRLHRVLGVAGEDRHALLARGLAELYPAASRQRPRDIPSWWRQPIYCGWGDQVAMSLYLEGPGPEWRCLSYCTQGLYRRWVNRLETAGVPIGITTIDAGWSPGGDWSPHPVQWPDLRGFIDQEHNAGRRVLLWLGTWLHEGLPDEWCIFAGKQRLCANPMHPEYRKFLRRQVQRLLSDEVGGFNADGFKIDQLGWLPAESHAFNSAHFGRIEPLEEPHARIKLDSEKWGCELLYDLQKQIYDAAKAVKPDCLITSSTVHPYFHDSFDMVRLHDTGRARGSVVEAMQSRADLARAALPQHLIDADDWIPWNYAKWLQYTLESHRLGTPCLFYSEWFVRSFDKNPTVQPIQRADLGKIARVWRKYQENLSEESQ